MAKIVLAVPLIYENEQDPIVEYQGFTTLNAYLSEQGHQVTVIDTYVEQISIIELADKLANIDCEYIGFTVMSSQGIHNMAQLNRILGFEMRKIKIFAGGIYATLMAEEILKEHAFIDYIVIGDGELTIQEMLEQKKDITDVQGVVLRQANGIISTGIRPALSEDQLNSFPMPKYSYVTEILERGEELQIISSRGCYGDCSFCGVNAYGNRIGCKQWRALSAERVVAEMEYLYNNYNVSVINFADDNFVGFGEKGKKRAIAIADLLIEKQLNFNFTMYSRINDFDMEAFAKLKEAGLQRVFIGIEFGVQRMLDFYGKGIQLSNSKYVLQSLRELDIHCSQGYIMFEPLMTMEEFIENLTFYYENCRFIIVQLTVKLEVFRYSAVYERLKNLIDIDEESTFGTMGDICLYRFKHKKVGLLHEALSYAIPSILPSKSYRHIFDIGDPECFDELLKKWCHGIYQIVFETAHFIIDTDESALDQDRLNQKIKELFIEFDGYYYDVVDERLFEVS